MTTENVSTERHEWVAPGPHDLRGPCPFLNTLANHSYIPHDGRNLHFQQLVNIQHEMFNMSKVLAGSLAFEAVFLCGNGITVSLEEIRTHNIIEHDASLVHDPISTGNSWTVNPKLVDAMIADASDPNGLTFHDIAKTRNRVEKAMINNPTHRLDFAHNKIALGEASLVIGVLGLGEGDDLTKRVVPIERLRSVLLHEKIPEDWERPKHEMTFAETLDMGGKLRAEMDRLLELEKNGGVETSTANTSGAKL